MKINKKELPGFMVYQLIIIIVIFIILFFILPTMHKLKKEMMYTSGAEDGDKVYVDVVNLEPQYTVGEMLKKGQFSITNNLVCLCQTTLGENVWVYMRIQEYEDFEGAYSEESTFLGVTSTWYGPISFENPIRIHGYVRDSDQLVENMSSRIDSQQVIKYESYD